MAQARVRKERTIPELVQAHGRARLVVVACEVCGRWSDEALSFLNSLANAKVRHEPEDFRRVLKAAWLRRWKALHSLCLSWNDVVLLDVTVPRFPQLRWSGPTGTRRSAGSRECVYRGEVSSCLRHGCMG